jgi:hypothetical protein
MQQHNILEPADPLLGGQHLNLKAVDPVPAALPTPLPSPSDPAPNPLPILSQPLHKILLHLHSPIHLQQSHPLAVRSQATLVLFGWVPRAVLFEGGWVCGGRGGLVWGCRLGVAALGQLDCGLVGGRQARWQAGFCWEGER